MKTQQLSTIFLPNILLIIIIFTFVFSSTALANNGPHGSYSALTDACAGCHRGHTAGAGRLLLYDVPTLCLSCHGSAGTGASTNVEDGVYNGPGVGVVTQIT